ncbi:MAG: asparagine synthase (glutamine-hydrolyzing) [Desulfobacterales bacterium]|nr:MAG: asparagine synthase (glutamine-hydrolyzing) [Desulfobacterales bacterium]
MCGIAGIVSINGSHVEPQAVKVMCDTISHRGPDDAGYVFFRLSESRLGEGGYWSEFADPEFKHINEHLPVFGGAYFKEETGKHCFSVGLGHRRLAVIDLTHYGHQPMSSSDRRYWVVYNGEIYNHLEIKRELDTRGHVFRTRSDTEVLLHLWEEYNIDSLEMLNGMFAFAIYDRHDNRLVLARDRFGVKPLYYAYSHGFFIFASEIKAILASDLVSAEVNPEALVEYFTFQNIYRHHTLFKKIQLLQPGEFLEIIPGSGKQSEPQRYHDAFPAAASVSFDSGDDAKDVIARAFAKAVKRQLISDVEVGSYLSGGMDSGSIVSVAGRSIPRLMTFTGGFDLTNVDGIEQSYDEREIAERLSYLLQTEHYAVVLHAGDMPAAMEKISWHVDDPRVGMCHQNWYVAKLASRFVKVCLAGAGGDELFAGYPWRYRPVVGAKNFEDFDHACYLYWHRLLFPDEIRSLFIPEFQQYYEATWQSFQQVMEGAPIWQQDLSPFDNLLQRARFFEFRTFLHGFLIIEDRMSMAHSLETRVPFLDNDLVDLAWELRPTLKLGENGLGDLRDNHYFESAEGKLILRNAMQDYLPKEFLHQRKQGFSPPDENWYRGPSMTYIKEILYDKQAVSRPYFDHQFVQAKLEEHFQGRRNHRLLIWSLLSFEWLNRHYLD